MKFFMLNAGKELSTELIFSHVWKNETDVNKTIVLDICILSAGKIGIH